MTSRELLKSKSLKATRSRIALLDTLLQAENPLTVEELHTRTSDGSDLVTVYRGLENFLKSGLVRQVHLKDDSVRFELADEHHHHHLVCTSCGLIDELPTCKVSDLEVNALKHSTRFASIAEHSLEFYGSCKACARTV